MKPIVVLLLTLVCLVMPLVGECLATYHPALGKWLNRDLPGQSDDPNLYSYVSSNPGLYCDPAGRYKLLYHGQMIAKTMHARGYQAQAIQATHRGSLFTDIMGNSVFEIAPASQRFTPQDALQKSRDVLRGMHFDNLKDYAAVSAAWKRLEEMAKKSCEPCDPLKILTNWGSLLHAVQDFYAHSNWAEVMAGSGYGKDNMPTWDSMQAALADPETRAAAQALLDKVYTGSFPGSPDDPKSHSRMNKDDPTRPNYAESRAAADAATAEWLNRLEKLAGEECVKRLKAWDDPRAVAQIMRDVHEMEALAEAAGQWK